MKHLACLLLLSLLALPIFATTTVRHHARSITGQYMVLLDTKIPAAAYDGIVNSLSHTYGLEIRTKWREEPRGFVASVPVAGAERLATDARVRIVEEDFPISIDAESGNQWTIWNNNYLWFLDRLDEPTYATHDSTYDMCPEGRTVNAYVIDNGVRGDHEQFTWNGEPAGRVESLNFANGAQGTADGLNGCPSNASMWHGTAVATVLGGTTTGASKAHIVSLRVVDCNNSGSASDWVSAVNWIRGANDPHRYQSGVVNMSRFLGDWMSDFATLNAAISGRVDATQIPFFVSANNFSADACKFSPASLAYTNMNHSGKVFSVGGTSLGAGSDTNDYRWQTWNGSQILLGQDSGSNGGACISIYAPAASIYAGRNTSTTAYDIASGTSFSAPLAAAIALRHLEVTGNQGYQQVFDYLLSTAGSSALINHVETPESWMCLSSINGRYEAYLTNPPSTCDGTYNIGENGVLHGPPIHFNATSNSSGAGMLYSAMTCP